MWRDARPSTSCLFGFLLKYNIIKYSRSSHCAQFDRRKIELYTNQSNMKILAKVNFFPSLKMSACHQKLKQKLKSWKKFIFLDITSPLKLILPSEPVTHLALLWKNAQYMRQCNERTCCKLLWYKADVRTCWCIPRKENEKKILSQILFLQCVGILMKRKNSGLYEEFRKHFRL